MSARDLNRTPLVELEGLYRSRHARFRRVAFALLRNREDAREAVQEAFARAVRAQESFRGEGDLEAWVWRTLTNICLDARRQDARRNGNAAVEPEPRAEASGDLGEDVREAVGLLPERQRLVLFLRYYADLPYDGIGRVLGIERGTVAATLHAAHASLRHRAGFGCFRIATQYGATYARGYSISGRFTDKMGARFNDLGALDGCEIQGSYGHRWPDKLGSHSAVEFAFTERARRYFTDRAAARDLALFVRTKEVQRIRRLAPAALERELEARYGGQIVQLATQAARPPAGKIGYWIGPERTVFSRISDTGRRLYVDIEDGRIARHNLEKMAFVF